jgi:hypothetical protein
MTNRCRAGTLWKNSFLPIGKHVSKQYSTKFRCQKSIRKSNFHIQVQNADGDDSLLDDRKEPLPAQLAAELRRVASCFIAVAEKLESEAINE